MGAFFPFGNAYSYAYDPYSGVEYGDKWSGLASGGLMIEADVGFRFARRYIVYAFWEHAKMGIGNDPTWRTGTHWAELRAFGDRGIGELRFSGTRLSMDRASRRHGPRGGPRARLPLVQRDLDQRDRNQHGGLRRLSLGSGVDTQINRSFSISPMLMFSSGTFNDRRITLPNVKEQPLPGYAGSHGTFTLSVGGHFDFGN